MTHVSGPDFIALQVRDLERAAAFYEQEIGLKRTSTPPGVSGVVVFETSTIPFGLREPLPGTDLEAGPLGLGVSLSLHVDEAKALHTDSEDGQQILALAHGGVHLFSGQAGLKEKMGRLTNKRPLSKRLLS